MLRLARFPPTWARESFHSMSEASTRVKWYAKMPAPSIPTVGTRSQWVNGAVADFFANHPDLELGGVRGFAVERQRHMDIFALHNIHKTRINPIGEVEFTAIRGPHGTIPIRILYPLSGEGRRARGEAGALVYFHGGGYSVGSVDEFENGLRLVAEESGCQVILSSIS